MMDNAYIQSPTTIEHLDFYKHQNKSKRILIIDDDIEFRLILSELLVGQGYSISTAKGARAAIRTLSMMDELPQLILLDSHMPEGNGYEFIELKKRMANYSHIPVVVISGDMMASEYFKKKGVSTCLAKPLDMLEVIDVVQKKMGAS